MDTRPVTPSGPWVDHGSGVLGRAVIAGGIAIGLMFGLGWWVLAGQKVIRAPVGEEALPSGEAPAQLVPLVTPAGGTSLPAMPAPPLPSRSAATSPPAPAPVRSPTAAPYPTTPPVVVTAHYATTSSWDNGYVGKITITNASGGSQYYDVQVELPDRVYVTDSWNNNSGNGYASVSSRDHTVTFQGSVGGQSSIVVGFRASKDRSLYRRWQYEPTSCTINGNACG